VISSKDAKIHVSGHANRGELLYMYNILKPVAVLPIHGEAHHLQANRNIAIETGVADRNAFDCRSGHIIEIEANNAPVVVGHLDNSYVYVENKKVGAVDDHDLEDRLTMGQEGFVSIVVAADGHGRHVVGEVEITSRGMAVDDGIFDPVKQDVVDAVEKQLQNGNFDEYHLSRAVRRVVGQYVGKKLRKSPLLMPVVKLV
jgi:ribonuclease J